VPLSNVRASAGEYRPNQTINLLAAEKQISNYRSRYCPSIDLRASRILRLMLFLSVCHEVRLDPRRLNLPAGSIGPSRTSRFQRGGSPNILRITLSASASKHRPWLSKIRCGCHEWIFLIATSAFCRWRNSGNCMPKKI
jgi:hypothetical protein